jgi:hypothetical protein
MPHNQELEMLGSLVESAESQRTSQHTTTLQEYVNTHPQIADLTLQMTAEIKQKLLFYVGNADKEAQQQLQEEVAELGRQLANLSEKPNVLHQLLCEEILTSYLMLRCADTAYARHQGSLTTMALRRADSAQIRFLRALKTLAQIHQRLPQIVNVNLGHQQIALTN